MIVSEFKIERLQPEKSRNMFERIQKMKKNIVLGLEKSSRRKIGPRRDYSGPKTMFFEWQDPFFLKKAVHKGLNYTWNFFGQELSILSVFK